MNWISVKERLPEIGDTVLVYYRRGDDRGVDILRYVGQWVTVDWYTKVTHWMPLPEPPEGGVTVEPDRLHAARTKIARARFSPEWLVRESEAFGNDCPNGRCEW